MKNEFSISSNLGQWNLFKEPIQNLSIIHSKHRGINPSSQKQHPPLSCQDPPLKSANCPIPLFRQSPSISVFYELHPLKILQWMPKILKFFILNLILSFKSKKFLVKISQFGFLVMTEKNTFVYKLFLSLNISDFSVFFCFFVLVKIATLQPPFLKKVTPSFPATPSQSWGPVKPFPFLKIWLEVQPTPNRKGECTLSLDLQNLHNPPQGFPYWGDGRSPPTSQKNCSSSPTRKVSSPMDSPQQSGN